MLCFASCRSCCTDRIPTEMSDDWRASLRADFKSTALPVEASPPCKSAGIYETPGRWGGSDLRTGYAALR